jgi:hypothetical protein
MSAAKETKPGRADDIIAAMIEGMAAYNEDPTEYEERKWKQERSGHAFDPKKHGGKGPGDPGWDDTL